MIHVMSPLPGAARRGRSAPAHRAPDAREPPFRFAGLQRQQTLAKAKVAEAEGDAQATLVKATAQAEANQLLQEALTPLLIQNKAIERWNGTLPQFTGGGAVPFLNLKDRGGGSGEGRSTAPGQ